MSLLLLFLFSCSPAQTKKDSNAQILLVGRLAFLCGGTKAAPLQQHDTIPNSLHIPTATHKATHSMHSITFRVSQFWKLRKCLRGVQSNPSLGQPAWGSVSTMKTCTMEGTGLLQTSTVSCFTNCAIAAMGFCKPSRASLQCKIPCLRFVPRVCTCGPTRKQRLLGLVVRFPRKAGDARPQFPVESA